MGVFVVPVLPEHASPLTTLTDTYLESSSTSQSALNKSAA